MDPPDSFFRDSSNPTRDSNASTRDWTDFDLGYFLCLFFQKETKYSRFCSQTVASMTKCCQDRRQAPR